VLLGVAVAGGLSAGGVEAAGLIVAASLGGICPDFDTAIYFVHKRKLHIERDFPDHHRYPTHTPLFYLLLLGVPLTLSLLQGWPTLISQMLAVGLAGALLHLFLDLFWTNGIMLFWPLSWSMYNIYLQTTDEISQFVPYRGTPADRVERALEAAATAAVIYCLIQVL
jgi:membrane-bound metal-dependent hydrolase YbcI (DUF457 family)